MSHILEVSDFCKSFLVKKRLLGENDVVSAVNHVSFHLEEGEVLGISQYAIHGREWICAGQVR